MKEFSKTFLGQEVHFHVLKLKQSFLLWIGTNVSFKALAVAMQTRLVCLSACPYCTVIVLLKRDVLYRHVN